MGAKLDNYSIKSVQLPGKDSKEGFDFQDYKIRHFLGNKMAGHNSHHYAKYQNNFPQTLAKQRVQFPQHFWIGNWHRLCVIDFFVGGG